MIAPPFELLDTVIDPLAAPAAVGSKLTCSVIDWPGFNVTGSVPPETPKPLPITATELIVSAAVPDEVKVSVLFVVVFSVTLP